MDNEKSVRIIEHLAESGDAQAVQTLNQLNRVIAQFNDGREQRLNTEIGNKIKQITNVLGSPTAVSSRDPELPRKIIDVAVEWEELLTVGEDAEQELE